VKNYKCTFQDCWWGRFAS